MDLARELKMPWIMMVLSIVVGVLKRVRKDLENIMEEVEMSAKFENIKIQHC